MRTVLLGFLQGPVAWLLVSLSVSLTLQFRYGFAPSATIGVSLLSGAFAWASAGLLLSAFHRWRERAVIMGGVAGVAPDPMPAHLVRLQRGVEALPQLGVLDRLLVGGTPAVLLPAVDPPGDALADILAVSGEIDDA